jgi:cytochrome c
MKIFNGFILFASVILSNGAWSTSMPALAKEQGCTACHSIDTKIIGPAWKDVAAKYKDHPDAATYLNNKIAQGGSGAWGSIAMPPQPKLSEADRKQLIDFILGLIK